MSTRSIKELLYDSEAALRLVDTALAELRQNPTAEPGVGEAPGCTAAAPQEGALAALPDMLRRVSCELSGALTSLRQSRGALERAAVERLKHTNDKLREVSSATEVAATDILDAIDRSLALVDAMDECATAEVDRSAELRTKLREELFGVMGCLQFQDIATQQLNYASSVLVDMECRLLQIARILDPNSIQEEPAAVENGTSPPAAAFDPAATNADANQRQALADQIFTSAGQR
jgi:chemotaxis regulatin CheY-phosphate phosphatase CheZ